MKREKNPPTTITTQSGNRQPATDAPTQFSQPVEAALSKEEIELRREEAIQKLLDATSSQSTEEIEQLAEMKLEKSDFDDEDYPEYGPIRKLVSDLSDREKVLICLMKSMMFADNYGSLSGKYLEEIYSETTARCREETLKIITRQDDSEIVTLATLSEVIGGLS